MWRGWLGPLREVISSDRHLCSRIPLSLCHWHGCGCPTRSRGWPAALEGGHTPLLELSWPIGSYHFSASSRWRGWWRSSCHILYGNLVARVPQIDMQRRLVLPCHNQLLECQTHLPHHVAVCLLLWHSWRVNVDRLRCVMEFPHNLLQWGGHTLCCEILGVSLSQ